MRLLARREDLDGGFGEEVAVDGRREAPDRPASPSLPALRRPASRVEPPATSRRRWSANVDSGLLRLGERDGRQRPHQRAALADGAGDQSFDSGEAI